MYKFFIFTFSEARGLFALMMAGLVYFILALIPLAFIIAFSGLKLGIALIQA